MDGCKDAAVVGIPKLEESIHLFHLELLDKLIEPLKSERNNKCLTYNDIRLPYLLPVLAKANS